MSDQLILPINGLSVFSEYHPDNLQYQTILKATHIDNKTDVLGTDIYANVMLSIGSAWFLRCCGAASFIGLDGQAANTRQAQDFVRLLKANTQSYLTYYFLPSTSQLNFAKKSPESVLAILMNLGAVEVSRHQNHYHGPNSMHMMVWVAKDAPWEKYLDPETNNPLWFHNLSEKEKQKVYVESIARAKERELRETTFRAEQLKTHKIESRRQFENQMRQHMYDDVLANLGWVQKKEMVK